MDITLGLCASAFDPKHSPSEVCKTLEEVIRSQQNASPQTMQFMNGILSFARFLQGSAMDGASMKEEVSRLLLLPLHWQATHTFVLEYLLCPGRVPDTPLIIFVHDISCGLNLELTNFSHNLSPILERMAKAEYDSSTMGMQLCFMTSLLTHHAEILCMEAVTDTLTHMYALLKQHDTLPEITCLLLSHPGVVNSLFFHKKTRRMVCTAMREGLATANILKEECTMLAQYMSIGPYETHMIFLELGETLEKYPYAPLMKVFLTSSPRYPFKPSTWTLLKDQPHDEDTKCCLEQRTQTVKTKEHDAVDVASVRPGQWFCRVAK